MKLKTRRADALTVAAGALAILASDALNGITPNDRRLYALLASVGVDEATAAAAVKRLRAAVEAEAGALIGRRPMSQAMRLMVSQHTDEWYTPAWVLDLARQILGGIDLDPASSPTAQRAVQAAAYFTQADDGYRQPWRGRVWLNPPFSEAERWARRLAAAYVDGDVTTGLLLVNSAPGYNWYEQLVDAWPAIQFRKRLAFTRADGRPAGLAKKSQTLVYFGADVARFYEVLAPYGRPLAQREGARLVAPLWGEEQAA